MCSVFSGEVSESLVGDLRLYVTKGTKGYGRCWNLLRCVVRCAGVSSFDVRCAHVAVISAGRWQVTGWSVAGQDFFLPIAFRLKLNIAGKHHSQFRLGESFNGFTKAACTCFVKGPKACRCTCLHS